MESFVCDRNFFIQINTTTNTAFTDPVFCYMLNIHASKYKYASQVSAANHDSITVQTYCFNYTNTLTRNNIKVY